MRFLCDRSLGRHKVRAALRAHGIDAIALDDHLLLYHEDGDDVWLSDVGQRGWIVLTKDSKMRARAPEKQALITYNIGCFAIAAGNRTGDEMASIFLAAWKQIEAISANEPRPFYYVVHKDGSVHRRML